MQQVSVRDLKCWSDTLRFKSIAHQYSSRDLIFGSFFGERNAVKAVWARLSGKRETCALNQDTYFGLVTGDKYITIQSSMGRQMLHLIMVHPACTHQYTAFANGFMQVGPEPEVRFFPRLNRMCAVPFKPAWREYLWDQGLEKGLIKALPGFGVPGYSIMTTDTWAEVVKTGIQSRELV